MALDWEFIRSVESKELTDVQAEVLYDQLIQYDVNGSESAEQLRRLFNASRQVMQVKAIQADVAIEELEEVISRESTNQKAIKSNLDNGDLAAVHRQQSMELERANELLRTQLNEKDVELNRLEQTKSNLEQTLKLNERQLQNYSQEIEQLREELHIEKEQINEQLADHNLPFEQLRDMNKKFYMLLEEMKDMETMNSQLGEKVNKLNGELDSATHQIQTATKEMQYMKNNLNNLQEMNDMLINEKEEHLNELRRLKALTSNYETESGEYLDSSSKKIHDLSEQLKQREQELKELKSKFESMDRKRIEEEKGLFLKEISKRDNHIKLLRNQLSQAIDDIEAQTRVIESLIEKNIETIHKSDHPESSSTGATDSQVLNGKQLIAKLEEELKSKDKEMTILHQRNTLYEQGIYGLSEAVEEINKLSKLTRSKDNEIESLIKELNSINLKLSNTQDELDYLKEFMNADDDLKRKLNEESDVKNDKLKILKLQKEVIRLDAEKLRLYEELLSFKLGGGPTKPKKPADLLNSDLTEISNQSTKDDLKDIKQLQKLNSLQELENENRELQLAMKEILIGLKESDSKSDVIIDCPSLERLCQFFESRSINSSLANVIALKAELDILRGHNEELRMTNKRLRNDIFKIFENYSKQLLTDFVNKHDSEKEAKDGPTNMEKNNQTLTEDELYDSDLSEGEIVLNSISVKKSRKQQNQETQTDAEDLLRQNSDAQEDKRKPEKSLDKNHSTSKTSSDDDFNKSSLDAGRPDGADRPAANEPLEENGAKSSGQAKDQTPMDLSADVSEQNTFTIEKSFIEQNTQTDLCLEDLKNANHLKEINSLNLSVDDLKSFVHQKDLIDKPAGSASLPKKDATSQTIDIPLTTDATGCAQCSMVQNLLVEFQNKIDRIDSSVVQREDLFTERINVLQQENNRLQTELQKIVQIKDDLLNQKDKQIIELNDRIVSQREKVLNLEESLKSRRESSEKKENDSKKEESPPSVDKGDTSLADQTSLDKQSIDKQLAIINKGALDSTNQRGLINILETIIKCLQARIEHKDEAIAHYQQLLTKTQEEHQKEIQKLMKNYEKVTQHSIKAIQSSSNVNQEHLESTLAKYNEQLNEQKAYHQKQLAEQMKAFELQSCKMKRIKSENERLKSQAGSMEELNRLRLENDQLNKMVEKNVKFIEKLKNAIREERDAKQDAKSDLRGRQEEKGRLMMIGKLKEEIENLHKVMISKDKHIKELQLAKWNLEKKIGEVMQANKAELKAKSEELEKMISDQTRLRNQLERLEKERSASRRRQATVIKEPKMEDKEMRVEKVVKFEDNSGAFMEKFRQLDQTISTLKMQLQNCAHRERELISLLETKGLARNEVRERVRGNVSRENASEDVRPKKEFSIQTIKGKKFEIRKNSCDF